MQNLEMYEAKLNEKLSLVVAELNQIASHNDTTDDWEAVPEVMDSGDADENTHADASEELANRTAMVATLEQDYRNLKLALQKIAAGNYGICEVSGEPIEEERLNFKPDARTCHAHMDEEANLPI